HYGAALQRFRYERLFQGWWHAGKNSGQPPLRARPQHPEDLPAAEHHRYGLQLRHRGADERAAAAGSLSWRLEHQQLVAREREISLLQERPDPALRIVRTRDEPAGLRDEVPEQPLQRDR